MERQVRIKNSSSNEIKTHTISATTFGELQEELGLDLDGKKVIVRETRQTLELADAKLPDGDFTLYIMPKKTKAGADLTRKEVDDMGHSDLRKACAERDLKAVHISSNQMRANLYDWIEANSSVESASKEEIIGLLNNAISKIEELQAGSNKDYMEIIQRDFERVKAELEG